MNEMEKVVTKAVVQRLMIILGITPKGNGYKYLPAAIMLKLESRPDNIVMTEVCRIIGEAHNVSAKSVEKSMRFAVSRAYGVNKLEGINDMYNATVITAEPTLADFVMYVVEYLYTFYQYDDFL